MPEKKIGVIGVGAIARWAHIPGILRSPDLRLWALCDTDTAALESASREYGIPMERCYHSGEELIARAGVDAVDICTPNDAHVPIALQAAEAGLSFSVEKPLALSLSQAQQLADEVRRRHLSSMVCFSYRFKAAARYARELVRGGELGEIYHVNMRYFQAWGLPVCNTPLLWRFVSGRTGSGALGDLGSHGLDLVRFVTGREYERLISHQGTFVREREKLDGSGLGPVDVDDFSNTLACMEGGLPAVFEITRFAYGRGNYQRMEIYGSRGSLVYELDARPDQDTLSLCQGEAMRRGNTYVELTIPGEYRIDQTQSFADILLGRGDGLSATVEDGLKNQRAMEAALRSAASGQWEKV